jgi:hypothetical protein
MSGAIFFKNPGNPFMGSAMLGRPQVTDSLTALTASRTSRVAIWFTFRVTRSEAAILKTFLADRHAVAAGLQIRQDVRP